MSPLLLIYVKDFLAENLILLCGFVRKILVTDVGLVDTSESGKVRKEMRC
jgi:hypothetical protein